MQLCFLIEKKELYLEQVLVEYNDIPIFFVCKNLKNYYIALCTDVDESKYIVVRTSLRDMVQMLNGKIAMRDVITSQKFFWEILAGEDMEEDIVEKKDITLIDESELPDEGALYKVVTDEMQEYLEKISNELYMKIIKP